MQRAKRSKTLPVILTRDETDRVLTAGKIALRLRP